MTTPSIVAHSKRERLAVLHAQLEQDRQSFIPLWKDLSDFIRPWRGRFFGDKVNRGDRRSKQIIDSTGTFASRTLASGMMAGITPPSRPWYRLSVPDQDVAEAPAVKEWLHASTTRMLAVMAQSNIYNVLGEMYADMGDFGTGAIAVFEDDEDVIHCESFPIGSYWMGNDRKRRVRVFLREMKMTVRQLIEAFGRRKWADDGTRPIDWSRFSEHVKGLYTQNRLEAWVDVCHVVEPNDEWDPNKAESRYKPFVSIYYEKGSYADVGASSWDRWLDYSGYDEFPMLIGRWDVNGEDVYAVGSPGITALGDIRQLQLGEKRGAQAIELMVRPPLNAPSSMKGQRVSFLPNDVNYLETIAGSQKLEPMIAIDPRIVELEQKQEQKRFLIRRAFYEDLFLMLAQSDRRDITAREIDERHEEKFLILGPMLERLNKDVLNPLIDRLFAIMIRKGLIPPPPEELEGRPLRVDYLSQMVQAQRLVGLPHIERIASFTLQLATVQPEVMDKVDTDQLIDEYGEALGISPKIIRPDEAVVAIREERARVQAEQQAASTLKEAGAGAASLARADTSRPSALTDLIGAASGAE